MHLFVGQLNAEDSKIIVDVGAKKRLQLLLDILRKMQLISVLEQPCGQGIGAAEPLTVFVLEPEAWFEEPDPQAEDGVASRSPLPALPLKLKAHSDHRKPNRCGGGVLHQV